MILKTFQRLVFVLLSTVLLVILMCTTVLASTCTGSVSYTWPNYTCEINSYLGYKVCVGPDSISQTSNCKFFNSGVCGYCKFHGNDCQDPPVSACYVETPPGGDYECGKNSWITTSSNCNLCVSVNGTNGQCATPPNNGSYCAWANLGSYFCSAGTGAATDDKGDDGNFNWTCAGTAGKCGGSNGTMAYCSATKTTPVSKIRYLFGYKQYSGTN